MVIENAHDYHSAALLIVLFIATYIFHTAQLESWYVLSESIPLFPIFSLIGFQFVFRIIDLYYFKLQNKP